MKNFKTHFLFIGILFFAIIQANAQYYGGGYGGYGGYGRGYSNVFNNSGFDNGKPKPPPDPDEVAKEETRVMVKKLKLSKDQEAVIASMNEDYAYQRQSVYENFKREIGNSQPTPDQLEKANEKMLAISAKKDKELEKILSADQYKTYQDMKPKTDKNGKKN